MRLKRSLGSLRIAVTVAFTVAIGLFVFLFFPAQPAEAASMTFTSNTTITSDQTIAAGETWTVNSGVKLVIAKGVTIINEGVIDMNEGVINNGTINNNFGGTINGNFGVFTNDGIIYFDINNGIINNNGTINNTAIINNSWLIQNFGTINNTKIINNSILIQNLGNFTNSGTIDNTGTISNKCVATFNDTGTLTGNPVSHEACMYNSLILEKAVDFNTSDLVINLGQEVRAIAMTNDNSVERITFSWISPTNDTVHTETLPVSFTFVNHFASFEDTFNIVAHDEFTPDEVGQWTLQMDFNNGFVVRETLNVRISVNPVFPIGSIAFSGPNVYVVSVSGGN